MRKLLVAYLLALPVPALAQDAPGRLMLEAGIDGGNSVACPGHYVGIEGRIVGPVSVYGSVDNYRCLDLAGTSSRLGVSVRVGPSDWLVRPALRAGVEYEGSRIVGASLTLGRRYGARFIVDRQPVSDGTTLVLLQLGGYISF